MQTLILFCAWCFDYRFGEVQRWHPLVGFGHLATQCEQWLRHGDSATFDRWMGIVGVCLLTLPLPILLSYLRWQWPILILLDSVIIYFCLAHNSLHQHAQAVYSALAKQDIKQARETCQWMVSRDTQTLDEPEIVRAVCESVLENSHDGVTATLFYGLIGGAPLALLHRLINTLDAMWGYRNPRFEYFGWCAARCDDGLGWLSAKFTSVIFLSQGQAWKKWRQVKTQANAYKSLNGGWVIASGAATLSIRLGGVAVYHGEPMHSPTLGNGPVATRNDIQNCLKLLNSSVRRIFILFAVIETIKLVHIWAYNS